MWLRAIADLMDLFIFGQFAAHNEIEKFKVDKKLEFNFKYI